MCCVYLTDVLKTKLTKFAAIFVKRRQKAGFVKPDKLQNQSNEGKRKEKKTERGEEKDLEKGNGCTLSFYITLEILFGPNKKLFDGKGPFGDNVVKNPARYTCSYTLL